MMFVTVKLAARYKQKLSARFVTQPFEMRFDKFRQMIGLVRRQREKRQLEAIVSRIANIQAERHDLTHGLWYWSPQTAHKIRVDHIRKKGRFNKRFECEAILNLSQRIAEVNFELCYPKGIEQRLEARSNTGNYWAREFLVAGKTSDPTLKWSREPVPPELQMALQRAIENFPKVAHGEDCQTDDSAQQSPIA